MTDKRAALRVAEFLDSSDAHALGIRPAEVRRVALVIVESAIDDLGVDPARLDGEGASRLLNETLPRRFGTNDPLLHRVPDILRSFFSYLASAEMVTSAFEIELALATVDGSDFERAVRAVGEGHRVAGRGDTIRSRGAKVGRNDPCPCGSGRKFKQCCAKLGS